MPLFVARIVVGDVYEIPVAAKSKRAARAYLRKNADWREDGVFPAGAAALMVKSVAQVNAPQEIPDDWPDDTLCWGHDTDTSIEMALIDKELAAIEPSVRDYPDDPDGEAAYEADWTSYFEEEKRRTSAIAAERKRGKS